VYFDSVAVDDGRLSDNVLGGCWEPQKMMSQNTSSRSGLSKCAAKITMRRKRSKKIAEVNARVHELSDGRRRGTFIFVPLLHVPKKEALFNEGAFQTKIFIAQISTFSHAKGIKLGIRRFSDGIIFYYIDAVLFFISWHWDAISNADKSSAVIASFVLTRPHLAL
jgi:hypothetical protein